MEHQDPTSTTTTPRRRRAAARPAGPPDDGSGAASSVPIAAEATGPAPATTTPVAADAAGPEPADPPARPKRARTKAAGSVPAEPTDKPKRARTKAAGSVPADPTDKPKRTRKKAAAPVAAESASAEQPDAPARRTRKAAQPPPTTPLFQPPAFVAAEPAPAAGRAASGDDDRSADEPDRAEAGEAIEDGEAPRRRRRRGGRGRRKKSTDQAEQLESDETKVSASVDHADDREPTTAAAAGEEPAEQSAETAEEAADEAAAATRRRRRRRRRKGEAEPGDTSTDDPPDTVVRIREPRPDTTDEVTSLKGSTRLEAKKQRRREGREAGRRRPPLISEAEFLARREAVDRVMVVRQIGQRTQIGVLEDGVLVEHYVSRSAQQSIVGNVHLGRVQNVLPAMEAAFVDIGRGRNAILYAGEVDWVGLGKADGPRRIEDALKSGQQVLVQVTKDPIGHKGARLTGQISLAGRYVVYVPGGSMSGISRKLPENERNRLKKILKQVVPDESAVIVRTAAEGASEEELTHDVSRLRAQWEDIAQKAATGNAPQLLYSEPDLAIKVVRDLFNEDFSKLVVSGDEAWDTIEAYVSYVASSLRDRLERWTGDGDVFAAYRIDEQIAKALDRKVWLPSGGSLVIDRTEAMTVVDVNTGKFTGSGGNLEETVTKNNLEAAEEVVRQLRLRDIGGIIVIDFIDMVLEANRDLVLRRLVECLGRDRTKHQVAEVTSLGLVQMTRKRIGTDLLEAFSEPCEHCNGRGLLVHLEPVEPAAKSAEAGGNGAGRGRGRPRARKAPQEPVPDIESVPDTGPADAMLSTGDDLTDLEPLSVRSEPGPDDGIAAATPTTETPEAATTPPADRPRRTRRRAVRPAGEPDAPRAAETEPITV